MRCWHVTHIWLTEAQTRLPMLLTQNTCMLVDVSLCWCFTKFTSHCRASQQFSVMLGWFPVFLGLNQYLKQNIKCLAQGHNAVPPVILQPGTKFGLKSNTPRSYVQLRLKWNICVFPVAYLSNFFIPTLNIKMVFGEKIPKMGTFSDFVTIFFVKCYNKI